MSEVTILVVYNHNSILYIYRLKSNVQEWAVKELRIKVCYLISYVFHILKESEVILDLKVYGTFKSDFLKDHDN